MDNEALLEACIRYGTHPDNLSALSRSGHNLVGAYADEGSERILKLTRGSHRSLEAVEAEVDWIHYLFQQGVSVSNPVPSLSGQFVERVNLDDDYVTAVAFVKAKGKSPTAEDLAHSDSLVRHMGRCMGSMHAVAKGYRPTSNRTRRPQWFEDANTVASITLPDSHMEIRQQYVELNQALAQLPVSTDSYGLVHMDFHYNNFFLDGTTMTVFDFEACRYSWFANDIAVALFHALPLHLSAESRIAYGKRFFTLFMEGYDEENHVDREWFTSIPAFIRHREIGRYIKLWRSCNGDVESLTGLNRDFMHNRKDYITEKIPFVDIDFHGF